MKFHFPREKTYVSVTSTGYLIIEQEDDEGEHNFVALSPRHARFIFQHAPSLLKEAECYFEMKLKGDSDEQES